MTRSLLLAPLTLLVALALPSSALAAVTATQVTTPAATVYRLIDGNIPESDPSHRLVVAGSASAGPGDQVDVRCAYRDPDGTVNTSGAFGDGEGVPVTDGKFSQDVSLIGQGACRIVATPTGALEPIDLTAFSGPAYFGAEQNTFTVGGGPNAALVNNFYVGSSRPTFDADFTSIGRGGAPYDMAPVDDSGDLPYFAQELWYGNAALLSESTKAGEQRSQLQVDGINAFAPYTAARLYTGAASVSGLPAITVDSVNVDEATGDVTHVSTEPFVTCPTSGGANVTAVAASPVTCGAFTASGVAVKRTVILRVATRSVETKDRWISTDGRAHDIDLLYNERQRQDGAQNGYRFPWVDGTTFKARAAGDDIALPPGRVASVFAKAKVDSPDDDPRYTQGSLTFSPRPDLIRFAGDSTFELGYKRNVPASGAVAIDQRFTVGTQRAAVESLAGEMEARASSGLGVAITSATQVSGYDPAYTLNGTTTTDGGVKALFVRGVAVMPDANGNWSTRVQLNPGANSVFVTLTDNNGDTASTSGNVTFTPGLTQSSLLTGTVRKGVLGATVRCQTLPGASCSGKLKLTARVTRVIRAKRGKKHRSTKTLTLASRVFKVPAGDRATPTARLSKTVRKLVRKYRIKRATLTLTQTVGGRTKTTQTSVAVKL